MIGRAGVRAQPTSISRRPRRLWWCVDRNAPSSKWTRWSPTTWTPLGAASRHFRCCHTRIVTGLGRHPHRRRARGRLGRGRPLSDRGRAPGDLLRRSTRPWRAARPACARRWRSRPCRTRCSRPTTSWPSACFGCRSPMICVACRWGGVPGGTASHLTPSEVMTAATLRTGAWGDSGRHAAGAHPVAWRRGAAVVVPSIGTGEAKVRHA